MTKAKMNDKKIRVYGARVHNLKNIDVTIPRHALTVITGLSGSGKTSLAFDTLFAEGQRRYLETFSTYAKAYIGMPERPDVDKITGLSPVISIEQKTTNKNPRSTVGTMTEVYDFLRVLFARAATAYSYVTGEKMTQYSEKQVTDLILKEYDKHRVMLLAPIVRNRKGHYRELFNTILRKGWLHVRIDGEVQEIVPNLKLDRYKTHSIEIVIDKFSVCSDNEARLARSIQAAMQQGEGEVVVLDADTQAERHFSKHLICPHSGISYRDPVPHNFSFNSPQGACPKCKGVGTIPQIDLNKVMPNPQLSIGGGAILPLGKYKDSFIFRQIEHVLDKYGANLHTAVADLPQEAVEEIIYGSLEQTPPFALPYEGIVGYIRSEQEKDDSPKTKKWGERFSKNIICPECHGARLNKEALHFRIKGMNIAQLSAMDIKDLSAWLNKLNPNTPDFSELQKKVISEILKELQPRLHTLVNLGLGYLSLNRASASLSGGESQRIRLASQIGSRLVNVLYILDEPSIGLHQRDNLQLINALKQLRDFGNTVIVVEHDEEMMRNADYIIDMGPRAGRLGGEVVFQGAPEEMLATNSLTAQYLNHTLLMPLPARRKGNGKLIAIKGASGNNLKHIDADFPLGLLIAVTGVSGSGKSSLINDTLKPILSQHLYRSLRQPLPYDSVTGLEFIDKAAAVDQLPIGRTPRSTPATYTGLYNNIRGLFASLPEAQIRGYKASRFSYNVSGGRCETCKGTGYLKIEMKFLPDVYTPCPDCRTMRFNRETLEVRYKGKSIADVLNMTVNQAADFFKNQPHILSQLAALQSVGLGYIKLGQPATTLSGGESQRVKLAAELAKRDTGRTVFILDEPTTGLHFDDVRQLLGVLNRLVDKGNTVIVIEHNLDVIKSADYVIDMGPEGGTDGGRILFAGTPEELALSGTGYTGAFLRKMLFPLRLDNIKQVRHAHDDGAVR